MTDCDAVALEHDDALLLLEDTPDGRVVQRNPLTHFTMAQHLTTGSQVVKLFLDAQILLADQELLDQVFCGLPAAPRLSVDGGEVALRKG